MTPQKWDKCQCSQKKLIQLKVQENLRNIFVAVCRQAAPYPTFLVSVAVPPVRAQTKK